MEAWKTVKVLDHGFVHFHDSMPAVPEYMQHTHGVFGVGDHRVVEAARVSMAHVPPDVVEAVGAAVDWDVELKRTLEQDVKLIDYLLKNGHTSPFEKVRFEFVVKLPIFVARQWIRHRMGSFNEASARYSKLPCEFYVPERERMQAQSVSNKQASGAVLPDFEAAVCLERIVESSKTAYAHYESMLEIGLSRELARMVVPPNFYTQWYWTVDLHNLFHFLKLRLHQHAQYEIRVYAEVLLRMIERVAPCSVAAFKQHTLGLQG